MRHVRTLGVSLIAMLALGAIMAAGASAELPEWGGCEATANGHYANSACTVKAAKHHGVYQGAYEWYTGEQFGAKYERETGQVNTSELSRHEFGNTQGVGDETDNIGHSTLETSEHKKIECNTGLIAFELENANPKGIRNGWLSLKGCESEGKECVSTSAQEEGELNNESQYFSGEGLKGTLGWVNKAKHEVGLSLTAFNTEGANIEERSLLEAFCEASGPESVRNLEIGGDTEGTNAVIGLITPVNEMAREYALSYSQNAGVQDPSVFQHTISHRLAAGYGLKGFQEGGWLPLGFSTPESEPIVLRPEDRFDFERWKVTAPIEIKAEK